MKKLLLAVLLLLTAALAALFPAVAQAAESAQFLKIQPAPRPMALAEAYTAAADDLWSLSSNPSGLSRMQSREAGFVHAELFDGLKYDYFAYGHPTQHGTFGLSGSYMTHGRLEGRDAAGNPNGGFEARDSMLALAFARPLGGGFSGGATVKYLESKLADRSGRSAALDLGLQAAVPGAPVPLTLGAAVLNMGQAPRLGDAREDLPLAVSFGGAARLAGLALVSMDVRHRPHALRNKTSFSVGTEYAVLSSVALRAGYSALTEPGTATGPLRGLGLGLGLKFRRFGLDYSFTPAGELGAAQRLAFTTRW